MYYYVKGKENQLDPEKWTGEIKLRQVNDLGFSFEK